MSNLQMALRHHEMLRYRLLSEFPELQDDEQTLADSLEGVSDLDQAIAAVVHSMDDDTALADGCQSRMYELAERIARFERRIATKRRLLAEAMESAGLRKVTAPDFTLSLTPVKAKVIVTDESSIPADYLTQPEPPAPKPDKRLILQALNEGHPVAGCTLSNGGQTVTLRRK